MPRRIIKKYLPDPHAIRNHKHLRMLGPLLQDPNLLHLNCRSVSGAVSVGLFLAWIPVPFQMLLAAGASLLVRVNMPIAVAMVWFSNPITMPPLFYFAYRLGAWILTQPTMDFTFELSFEWLSKSMHMIWQPFLLGCLVLAVFSSLIGGLSVRYFWRWKVGQSWKQRKMRRANKKPPNNKNE
ncbi:MAG: DUF2062 domain-containing protein [Thiohalomonadales bacterium]